MDTAARVAWSASAVAMAWFLSAPISANERETALIRIYNFAKVNPNYFRGGQPVGDDYADLAALGVKTVINLIGVDDEIQESEKADVERNGMTYVQFPMTTRKPPTPAELDAFLAVANDPASQPVYVHCVGGRHRTGLMTAVYRMTNDGITGKAAFAEMKQYKYGPDFLHPEFKSFVQSYKPTTRSAAVATSQQQ